LQRAAAAEKEEDRAAAALVERTKKIQYVVLLWHR
jgi:hypothetical protein